MQTSAHTKLERAQVLLNHQFKTTDYLWEALQCAGSGVLFSGARFIPDGNKRLAIIGDKLIDLVICQDWFATSDSKAAWTSAQQRAVSNKNLAEIGYTLGLDAVVNTNPSNPVQISQNIMSATIEALVAAVWLDNGRDIDGVKVFLEDLGISYH